MKKYTKDFTGFDLNENSRMAVPGLKAEAIEEEIKDLMAMLHRCALQAKMVNEMMYELEEPAAVMADSRNVAEKLKQIWSAFVTGDPRDTSALDEIFK